MIEPRRSPVALAAGRLGCTEGQVFTMLIGLVLALLLAVPGIPSALRDRDTRHVSGLALRPFTGGSAAASTSGPVGPARVDAADGRARLTPGAPGGGGFMRPGLPTIPWSSPGVTPPALRPAAGTVGVFARVGPPGVPGGLAVAPDGTVFVTTDNGSARGAPGPSHVISYAADGTRIASQPVAGQPDDRTGGLTGVAVDPTSGNLALLDPEGRRIVGVNVRSGVQSVLAEIPDLPACLISLGAALCQPGFEDRTPFPVSAVYDEHRNLFFTDPAQDTIWRLPRAARVPQVWYQSVDVSGGDGPFGLAVSGGVMEFTVGTSNDVAVLGAGALYRLMVNPDGSAGERTLVRAFERGDPPGPLAVASSGTSYVVLRNSGTIVAIAPDGSEARRIGPPGTGSIPLDGPSAVALAPGALLVANGRTSDDPARWAILTVAIDDGPTRASVANSSRPRTSQRGKMA